MCGSEQPHLLAAVYTSQYDWFSPNINGKKNLRYTLPRAAEAGKNGPHVSRYHKKWIIELIKSRDCPSITGMQCST